MAISVSTLEFKSCGLASCDAVSHTVVPFSMRHPDNELTVYNRWEQVVFHQKGYDNTWDGTWVQNGEPLPDGTYFYVLKRNPQNGKSAVLTGHVTIHR